MRAGRGGWSMRGGFLDQAEGFENAGDPIDAPLGETLVDEIAIDDQQFAAGLQHPQPFAEAGLRIHQGPDQVAGDDRVVAFVCLQRFFRVTKMEPDGARPGCGLGARQLQHRFRPVYAGHLIAEIVHEVRDHARSACKIERPAAFAPPEVLFNKPMPCRPLFFREDFVPR